MKAIITLEELNLKLNGKIWTKGDLKRIYLNRGFNTQKVKTNTYVEIVDGIFVVKCFVECNDQGFKWCKSQEQMVIEGVEKTIREYLATGFYYVLENDEIVDDTAEAKKITDLYVGGGFYLSAAVAQKFIDGEGLKKATIAFISKTALKEAEIVAKILKTENSTISENEIVNELLIVEELVEKPSAKEVVRTNEIEQKFNYLTEEEKNELFSQGFGKIKEMYVSNRGLEKRYFKNPNMSRKELDKSQTYIAEATEEMKKEAEIFRKNYYDLAPNKNNDRR